MSAHEEATMKVREILSEKGSEVVTIAGSMPASAAAQMMARRGIGAIAVSNDGETLAGLVRESEIVAAVAAGAGSLGSASVEQIMVKKVETCRPTDHIKAVMDQMTESRSRHLPVVKNGKLCGMISVGDLVKYRVEEVELENRVLRDVYLASH